MLYLEVRLKLQKAVSLRYNFHVPFRNGMVFQGTGAQRHFFRGKTRSQHTVCMHSAEVDALFQLNLEEFPAIWRDYGKR
jgi:hypothetical protein